MLENPFNPAFGQIPKILLNQTSVLTNYLENLKPMNPYRTSFLANVRGSGKTTFLSSVQHALKDNTDWFIIPLIIESNMFERFERKLAQKKPSASLKSLDANAFGLKAHLQFDTFPDSTLEQIEEHLTQLKKQNKNVLIIIDEISPSEVFTNFLKWYQIWIQQDYPIYLLGAGLPKLLLQTMESEGLTFLLRSNRIELEPLNRQTIQKSYQYIFKKIDCAFNDEAIDYIPNMINGFSYAYQLVGFELWKYVTHYHTSIISLTTLLEIEESIKDLLYENVYERIYRDLTPTERTFLQAMAKQTEHTKMSQLTDIMGNQNKAGQYRRRLIKQGVIRASGYGLISFNLPYFKDFLTITA